MSKDRINLGNNKADWAAVMAKGGLGAIPFAGSFLAEIAGALIPNQRLDRLIKYAAELNDKLEKTPEELMEQLRNNEQFIDLIEESLIRAGRANSEARRQYIVNIVRNGISDDEAYINNAKYLLGLLSELNDSEVIWLRYFYERTMNDRSQFRALHKNVLMPTQVVLGSSKEEKQQGAIQDSYTEHLERLGLIRHQIKINKDSNVPEYDRFSNKPQVYYSEATTLGAMLLENIGLINLD